MDFRVHPDDDSVLSILDGQCEKSMLTEESSDIDGRRFDWKLQLTGPAHEKMLTGWADRHARDVAAVINRPPLILPKSAVLASRSGVHSPVTKIWKPGASTGGGSVTRLRTWLTLAWLGQSSWTTKTADAELSLHYWVSVPQRLLRPFVERRPALGPVVKLELGSGELGSVWLYSSSIPGFGDPTRQVGTVLEELSQGHLIKHPSRNGVYRVALPAGWDRGRAAAQAGAFAPEDGPRHVYGLDETGCYRLIGRWSTSGSMLWEQDAYHPPKWLQPWESSVRIANRFWDGEIEPLAEEWFSGLAEEQIYRLGPHELAHFGRFEEIRHGDHDDRLNKLWLHPERDELVGAENGSEADHWFAIPSIFLERVFNRLEGRGVVVLLILLARGLGGGRPVEAPRGSADGIRYGVSADALNRGLRELELLKDDHGGPLVTTETRTRLGKRVTWVNLEKGFANR